MSISSLFKKLFIGGEWGIAYKTKDTTVYKEIESPKGIWFADPMLFEFADKHYLFSEVYENKKGRACLGYFEFVDGRPEFRERVIENNYHMSYPCIFQFQNTIYMIPETSANRSLELYKAIEFPSKWDLDCVLCKDCCFVDSTVYYSDEKLFLLSYEKVKAGWDLVIFILNLKGEKKIEEIDRKHYKSNTGRPAGNLFINSNGCFRPAQDCQKEYGERVIINQVDSLCPYLEKPVGEITVSDISVSKKVQRIHTYNEDSKYQVIDFFVEKFELFKSFSILKRLFFKK